MEITLVLCARGNEHSKHLTSLSPTTAAAIPLNLPELPVGVGMGMGQSPPSSPRLGCNAWASLLLRPSDHPRAVPGARRRAGCWTRARHRWSISRRVVTRGLHRLRFLRLRIQAQARDRFHTRNKALPSPARSAMKRGLRSCRRSPGPPRVSRCPGGGRQGGEPA